MGYKSSVASFDKALISKLRELSIPLGASSVFPRAEIADISEGRVVDKGDSVRPISFVIEVISDRSTEEAVSIMDDVEAGLVGEGTLTMTEFESISIDKVLETMLTEVGDADAVLHRIRTSFEAMVEIKQQ